MPPTSRGAPAPRVPPGTRRIRPRPDRITAGYWDAARNHVLAIQRCAECATFQHPPQPMCMSCGGPSVAFRPVSGRGRLVSWTTTFHPVVPSLEDELPYVCLVVELEEQDGLWLVSDLMGRPVEVGSLRQGMPVRAVFDCRVGDLVLPQFVPVEDRETR
jgi:uncharacterized OB-fold protein